MTPETKSVLQTLIRYRDEYYGMWLKKADKEKDMHLVVSARFLGQAQGLRILTNLMLLHYKTTEEVILEHTTE